MANFLELLDYRRAVADIYQSAMSSEPSIETWEKWCSDRDRLFASHPQTPIEDTSNFKGLPYFKYDREMRVMGRFFAYAGDETDIDHSADGATSFLNIGRVEFKIKDASQTLEVFWLNSYGGGIFLPFRDATNGRSTYGGGRYLLDTVKGADLGQTESGLILDFNYSYHPSCVHSYRWSCPLAPPTNKLDIEIAAGEKLPVVNEGHETR